MDCVLEIHEDIDELYRLFLPETLKSERAQCKISKTDKLRFTINAKDPVSMKALLNSILSSIQAYYKTREIK